MKIANSPFIPCTLAVLVGSVLCTPLLAAEGCWLDVYDRTNFEGAHARIDGPVDLSSLRDVDGGNWSSRIESLIVGPKAQVQAYRNEGFKEEKIQQPYHGEAMKAWKESAESESEQEISFGPGKKEHHLGELNFHQNINSLRLKCLP